MENSHENCPWDLIDEEHGLFRRYKGTFGRLRDAEFLIHVYCAGFRITDEPDEWSDYVTRFKSGEPRAVASGARILAHIIRHRRKVERMGPIVVCPILGSADVSFNPSNSVCSAFAAMMKEPPAVELQKLKTPVLDGRSLLYKNRPSKPLHKLASAAERMSAARNVYRSRRLGDVGLPQTDVVFLVDDIVTLGSSMNDAARAIREANPCVEVVAGVALAKSERRSFSGVTNEKLPEHVRRLAGLDSEEEARHAFLDDDDDDEYQGEEEEDDKEAREEEARHAFLDDDDDDEYQGEEEEDDKEAREEIYGKDSDDDEWDWGGMFISGSDDPPD